MSLTLFGLLLGLAGGLALNRLLVGLLFGVRATDAATYAAVIFVFLATAFLACLVPGRRASRVDPIVALRSE